MEQQVMELKDSTIECLEVLINNSSEIAKEFQAGNTGRANQCLIGYIENIACLVEAVEVLRRQGEIVNVETSSLQNVLQEMEQAMSSRDYVLLADVLEYEIKDVLIEIQGKF